MFSWIWTIIKLIILFTFLFSFLHSFVTHFMVWLEMRYKELRDDPHVIISWKSFIINFLTEATLTFTYFLMIPFSKLFDNKELTPINPRTPPILLVHGYFHNETDWMWFHKNLQAIDGIGPISTLSLFPNTDTIESHALILAKKIESIKRATQHNNIILIGHSRGGLVASYYAEFLAPKKEVEAIICLGTPFLGTKLSVFGSGPSGKELGPHSVFLCKLKEYIQYSSIPYYQVASKMDNLIVPWYSACPWEFRKRDNTLIIEDLGHLRLLLSTKVLTQVADWILKTYEQESEIEPSQEETV